MGFFGAVLLMGLFFLGCDVIGHLIHGDLASSFWSFAVVDLLILPALFLALALVAVIGSIIKDKLS